MTGPTLDEVMRDDGMVDVREIGLSDIGDALLDESETDDHALRTRVNRMRAAAKARQTKRSQRGAR